MKEPKQYSTGEKKNEMFQSSEKENMISRNFDSKADNKHSYNQQNNDSGDSLLSIFSLGDSNNYDATLAEDASPSSEEGRMNKTKQTITTNAAARATERTITALLTGFLLAAAEAGETDVWPTASCWQPGSGAEL